MEKLQVIDSETLLNTPFPKQFFVVEGLIPQGLSVFCGQSKIGKSWLMLYMGLQVSQGLPVMGCNTNKCDVLYLCLEDTYPRLRDRVYKLSDTGSSNLYLTIMAGGIGTGIEEQIEDFLSDYPETRFIMIDTLQKIRTNNKPTSKQGIYGDDYDDISSMKFLEESSPLGANHPAVKQYNKCMRGAGDTVRSIIISANSRLAFLENKQVLRLLSKDELNLSDIGIGVNGDGETKTALFCVIPDLLQNYTATTMLANSEFVALLKQANTDSSKMAEVIGVSEAQLRFVTNTSSGMGLIKCGSVVIPFDNQISKDTDLYRLYNTNIHERIEMMKKRRNYKILICSLKFKYNFGTKIKKCRNCIDKIESERYGIL